MPPALIFVYGTLKSGYRNAHLNAGVRRVGEFRTRSRLPLLLLGDGCVPCLVLLPGSGHQVLGEVYEVDEDAVSTMDTLERLGEPAGYLRVDIEIERFDDGRSDVIAAQAYVKPPDRITFENRRIGPLIEYTPEHALRFRW